MQRILNPKGFPVLAGVPDQLVQALNEALTVKHYDRGEVVYQRGDPATAIYFMLAGKGLFKAQVRPGMTVHLGALWPGYLFGWSAVFPDYKHHHSAVCSEASKIAEVSASDLHQLLESNQCAGYILLRNIFRLANERLELRTEQLLKLFETNPQMQKP